MQAEKDSTSNGGDEDDAASGYIIVPESSSSSIMKKEDITMKEEESHEQQHHQQRHASSSLSPKQAKRRSRCLSISSSTPCSNNKSNNMCQHSNLSKVVKGEIHNILSVLRSDPRYASPLRFQMELLPSLHHHHHTSSPIYSHSADGAASSTPMKTSRIFYGDEDDEEELSQHPLINSLHALNDMLTSEQETYYEQAQAREEPSSSSPEEAAAGISVVTYISPFATAASSPEISASITGAALEALHKFILYGFITPSSLNAKEGITIIARSIRHCTFEAEMISTSHSSSSKKGRNNNEEEVVVLKLLSLAVQVIRCEAGILLEPNDIVGIFDTCWHVILKAKHASDLLKSAAGDALGHIVLVVFSRATTLTSSPPQNTQQQQHQNHNQQRKQQQPAIVTILSHLTTYLNPLLHPTSTNVLSLTLLNIALETCTVTTFTTLTNTHPQLLPILQNDLCKHLLCLSTTQDLVLLTLTLRVIFNLFHAVNKDFLKVQLEVFLTSVHLRILMHNSTDASSLSSSSKTTSTAVLTSTRNMLEQREIALESLVEFCHEPALMMDIYLNYDCDLNCSNLFESICRALSFCAIGGSATGNNGDLLNMSLHGSSGEEGKAVMGRQDTDGEEGDEYQQQQQQQPLNSLNRLALEGILAVIDSIARRCILGPRTATETTVITTSTDDDEDDYDEEEAVKEDEEESGYLNESDDDMVKVLRKQSSICSGTDGDIEDDGNLSDGNIDPPSSSSFYHMESSSSIDDNYNHEQEDSNNNLVSTPQKQKHSHHHHHHHHLWHSPRSRERTEHILRKRKQRKQKNALIARDFNRSLSNKDWIKTGERVQILPTPATPQSVASFLFHSHTLLDKTKVGLYLSKGPDAKYPFHAQVRTEFVNLFDFRSMAFSAALRFFLKRFRLPGEAQCIDRLMEAFANRLYAQQCLKEDKEEGKKGDGKIEKEVEDGEDPKKVEKRFDDDDHAKQEENRHDTQDEKEDETSGGDELSSGEGTEKEEQTVNEDGDDESEPPSPPSTTESTSVRDDSDKNDNNSNSEKTSTNSIKSSPSSPFHSADAVFILAFSTIMLNTDLHNPNMKDEKRMTLEQFVRNNRGINDGEDLPRSFLADLYYQIKHKEIQVQGDTAEHVFSEVVAPTAAAASTSAGDGDDASSVASEAESTGGGTREKGSSTADAAWDGILSKSNEVETPFFTPSDKARKTLFRAGLHERDMFTSIVSMSIQCISSIFVRSWDDLLVVKALRGFRQMAEICVYFDLEEKLNEILEILLGYGRDYAMSTIALEGKVAHSTASTCGNEDGVGVDGVSSYRGENIQQKKEGDDSDDEEAMFDEIPYAVLTRDATSSSASTSSPSHFRDTVTGSASHRGLLSLNCALTLIRQHPYRIREAWRALVSCVFALRDADALPAGLSDLDDFADSHGVVLPLSPFARLSRRRVDAYIASVLTVEESDEGSGWFWHSLFGKQNKGQSSLTNNGGGAGGSSSVSSTMKQSIKHPSPLTDALLSVARSAEIDQILTRSRDLPRATQIIHVLLDAMDPAYYGSLPFSYSSTSSADGSHINATDPEGSDSDGAMANLLFEHHAVFALELAARALLSNRQCAPKLYPMFLSKFQSILAADGEGAQRQEQHESSPSSANGSNEESSPRRHPSSAALRALYVMERVVVTILRSCIHFYDMPEMRQYLKASLQLLADLPMEFVKHISDRLACGMAIILRGRFCQLEAVDEWNLVGDLLDRAANFRAGRRFVFDGIASSVDNATPPFSEDESDGKNGAGDNGVRVTYEGGYILVKLLTYFVFGTYDGDVSMRLLAMPRLEKMYWILFNMSADHSAVDEHNKPMDSMVPDEELWQIVASAFHECSLSEDLETARQGVEFAERFLLTTKPDSVSDVGWIAVLYDLSSRHPQIESDDVRVKYCALVGKILLLILPKLSQRKENWDALTSIVQHTADVIGTNLRAGRRGNVSPLFESTVQTVTNMCNVMSLPEFDGGTGFSQWAGETLLAELEKVGASGGAVSMIAATTRQPVVDG